MIASRLLKSCATPPASWPSESIRWIRCTWACSPSFCAELRGARVAPRVEQVLRVAAFAVLCRLGLVLGVAGVAALDAGPHVDPLLGIPGVPSRVSARTSVRSWASRASRRWISVRLLYMTGVASAAVSIVPSAWPCRSRPRGARLRAARRPSPARPGVGCLGPPRSGPGRRGRRGAGCRPARRSAPGHPGRPGAGCRPARRSAPGHRGRRGAGYRSAPGPASRRSLSIVPPRSGPKSGLLPRWPSMTPCSHRRRHPLG